MFQKMLQGGGVEQKDENIYVKHFDTLTANSNNRFLIDCDFTPKKISVFGTYNNQIMNSFYDERISTTNQHRFYNGSWGNIGISDNKYANIYKDKENGKFYINTANKYENVTILATTY